MITVEFHRSLLPFTNGIKEIQILPDTYVYVVKNCLNLFPKLEQVVLKQRFSKKDGIAIISQGRCLTKDDLFFPAKSGEKVQLVPVFFGGFGSELLLIAALSAAASTAIALAQGFDLGQALLRGFISGAFAYAGGFLAEGIVSDLALKGASALAVQGVAQGVFGTLSVLVANAVTGPPKVSAGGAADDASKINNDTFGSITNTTNQGEAVALNYGMVRVGGQLISAELETITDQREETVVIEDSYYESIISSGGPE